MFIQIDTLPGAQAGMAVDDGKAQVHLGVLKKLDNSHDLAIRPITQLNRVDPKVAERLARLGIHTVQDLLFHP